jgi:HemK family putative methylases
MAGESVARILGEREFYGLAFGLDAATLEPRPDTELLVDLALAALPAGGRLLDLGTGTGCIPVAILANRPDASGVATDLDAAALEMARRNAERHGVGPRLTLLRGDWFGALDPAHGAGFDLIVSNPPYIASAVIETLAPEVRDHDPRLALTGGRRARALPRHRGAGGGLAAAGRAGAGGDRLRPGAGGGRAVRRPGLRADRRSQGSGGS